MEALLEEHEKLCRKGNLSKSVEDVQKTIDLLVRARESIAASMFCLFPLWPIGSWAVISETCSFLLQRSE